MAVRKKRPRRTACNSIPKLKVPMHTHMHTHLHTCTHTHTHTHAHTYTRWGGGGGMASNAQLSPYFSFPIAGFTNVFS